MTWKFDSISIIESCIFDLLERFVELPILLSNFNTLWILGLCKSKSTTRTFFPELAKILAKLIDVKVLPSPGWIDVIKNDLNFEFESSFNRKLAEVLNDLKDSTKLSFDLILISSQIAI